MSDVTAKPAMQGNQMSNVQLMDEKLDVVLSTCI